MPNKYVSLEFTHRNYSDCFKANLIFHVTFVTSVLHLVHVTRPTNGQFVRTIRFAYKGGRFFFFKSQLNLGDNAYVAVLLENGKLNLRCFHTIN